MIITQHLELGKLTLPGLL